MEQKIKFILVGLIGISVIFIFLFLQTLSSKQKVIRQLQDMTEQNQSANEKLQKLQGSLRSYETKIDSLNKELGKVAKEKQDLDKQLESANKAKDELVDKLKVLEVQVGAKQPEITPPPPTDVYWAGILKAKKDLELQLANIRNDLKSTQINDEQLQREKNTLEIELNNLKREKEDLKRAFDYNQKLVDSLSQDLVREKNDKNKIKETFMVLRGENTMLLQQVKGLNERKISLERKLQNLQEDKVGLERKFNEMQVMLTDNLSQMKDLNKQVSSITSTTTPSKGSLAEKRESVELPPIVVRPQSEVRRMDEDFGEGKVLAVNKDSNFVIIDRGEDSGVKVGNRFRLEREGQYLADIEATQVRKNISACDIKKSTTSIQVGDSVIGN